MDNEIARLKTDLLNELGNEAYYLMDELKKIAIDKTMTQRERVSRSKEIITQITINENAAGRIETLFVVTEEPESLNNEDGGDSVPSTEDNTPSNVIESGQSHAE